MSTHQSVSVERKVVAATPIDGARRNLQTILPDLYREVSEKIKNIEGDLERLRSSRAWIERVASADGEVRLPKDGETIAAAPTSPLPEST